MSRIAVLKGGRSLERQVSLKSGARVEDALEHLGHEVDPDRRRRRPRRAADREPTRAGVRRAPRSRRRGRDRAGAARGDGHPAHRLGRVRVHPRGRQGARQARDARRRDPHPGVLRVQRDRVPGARRGAGAAGDRGAAPVPDRRQAGGPGVGARDQVRADPVGRAGGADRGVLVRPQGAARALRRRPRPRGLDHRRDRRRRGRSRSSRRSPQQEDFYDFESRYEIGRTRFVCPAELDEAVAERASAIALEVYELLGCRGSRAST